MVKDITKEDASNLKLLQVMAKVLKANPNLLQVSPNILHLSPKLLKPNLLQVMAKLLKPNQHQPHKLLVNHSQPHKLKAKKHLGREWQREQQIKCCLLPRKLEATKQVTFHYLLFMSMKTMTV